MLPLLLAPIISSLASNGLSLLAGALESKGKEFVEDRLGIKLPNSVEAMTPEFLQELKIKEMEHEEFLLSLQIKKAEIEIEAEKSASIQVTDRWKADLSSDSWLAKNIRPLVLLYLLTVVSLFAFLSGVSSFSVPELYVTMFGTLLNLAFTAYFVGRSSEKISSIWNKKEKKEEEK